jgi:hypothetical protein
VVGAAAVTPRSVFGFPITRIAHIVLICRQRNQEHGLLACVQDRRQLAVAWAISARASMGR